ncbi:MAG TPA: protein translocase subunit SecD, partial [Dehalococcoidia bacterium]|nr:protein translocase subunit SecD [Dehalococcoidia bacterium]
MKTATNIFVLLLILFSVWALLTPTVSVGGFERRDLKLGLDLRGGTHVVLEADLTQLAPGQKPEEAMDGAMKIIERRINAFGVAEATVQRAGGNRVIVQLPGVKDVGQTINLIGQTAQLDFRKQKLDETGQVVLDEKGEPVWVPATGTMDDKEVHLTGAFLKPNSFVELTPTTNQPVVHFEWNAEGAKLFKEITTELLNRPLGIFLDNELVSDPVVRAVIEDKGIIEGIRLDEARLLAIQLNAGALPIPLKVVQQEDVDAFLGADSLKRSLQAGVVGLGLVMLFLILYYRLPGLLASLALLYYGALLLAIFKLLPVTLTLAGIAGFIVSLGMA